MQNLVIQTIEGLSPGKKDKAGAFRVRNTLKQWLSGEG
jgi:hypothetical protein